MVLYPVANMEKLEVNHIDFNRISIAFCYDFIIPDGILCILSLSKKIGNVIMIGKAGHYGNVW